MTIILPGTTEINKDPVSLILPETYNSKNQREKIIEAIDNTISLSNMQQAIRTYREEYWIDELLKISKQHPAYKLLGLKPEHWEHIFWYQEIKKLYKNADDWTISIDEIDSIFSILLTFSTPLNKNIEEKNTVLIDLNQTKEENYTITKSIQEFLETIWIQSDMSLVTNESSSNNNSEMKNNELEEIENKIQTMKKKYDRLNAELKSDRLDWNELQRRQKEEELMRLEQKINKLQNMRDQLMLEQDKKNDTHDVKIVDENDEERDDDNDNIEIIDENDEERDDDNDNIEIVDENDEERDDDNDNIEIIDENDEERDDDNDNIEIVDENDEERDDDNDNIEKNKHWKDYKFKITWIKNNWDDEMQDLDQSLTINAVLSNAEEIHYNRIAKQVEKELQEEYWRINARNLIQRAKFRLNRRKTRIDRIEERLSHIARTPLIREDEELDAYLWNIADRHQIEWWHDTLYNEETTTVVESNLLENNARLQSLAEEYILGLINDWQFTYRFNMIVNEDNELQEALQRNNISYVATNIRLKLQEQRMQHQLLMNVQQILASYVSWNNWALWEIDQQIERYIDQCKSHPAWTDYLHSLTKQLQQSNDANTNKTIEKKIEKFLKHTEVCLKMQARNVKITLDILDQWDEAQFVRSDDRQDTLYQLWQKWEKLPAWLKITWTVTTGTIWWLLGGWFIVPWLVVWSIVWLKKYVDYTKEQNTHEKLSMTNYSEYMRKTSELEDIANNWDFLSQYRANRQLTLYYDMLNDQRISLAEQERVLRNSFRRFQTEWNENQTETLRTELIKTLVHLDHHNRIWHPTFYADSLYESEQQMLNLKKTLQFIERSIDNNALHHNTLRSTQEYMSLYNQVSTSYSEALQRFQDERILLSSKYWIASWVASWLLSWWFWKAINSLNEFFWWNTISSTSTITTSSTSWISSIETFWLWDHILSTATNSIYTDTYTALHPLVSSWDPINLTVSYWAWTDATWVINAVTSKLTHADYIDKLHHVRSSILWMGNLSTVQKTVFLNELSTAPWTTHAWTWFTNNALYMMRCLEIEHVAQAINDLWTGASWININLMHDPTLDVVWVTTHNASERLTAVELMITQEKTSFWVIEETAPIHVPITIPLFANTFEEEIEEVDEIEESNDRNK